MKKKISKFLVLLLTMVMVTGSCLSSVSADALFMDYDNDGSYDDVVYTDIMTDMLIDALIEEAQYQDADPDPDPDPPIPVPVPDPVPVPEPIPAPLPPMPTPNAYFDAASLTLSGLDSTMSYSFDSGRTWIAVPYGPNAVSVTDDQAEYALAHGISVISWGDYIATRDSECQIIAVHKVPTPNGVSGVNPTNGSNGQIINVNSSMQYRAGNSGWMDIGSNVIGGLSAGTYQVRGKAGGQAIASDAVTVTLTNTPTPAPVLPKEATPSADFNAMIGVLTGAEGTNYSIDGGRNWTNAGGNNKVSLDMSRLSTGNGIKLYRPGNNITTKDSDVQTIELRKAGTPTGITAVSATTTNQGVISGVNSAMEYMKQGASSWTPVSGSTIVAAPGNYCIRVSGAYTTLPSDAVAVTITQSITSAPVVVTPQKPTTTTGTTTGISGKKLVIMQVQTALNALGYKTGTPDGVLGKNTKNAIRKYQKANGLKVTGTVNTALVNSLKIK